MSRVSPGVIILKQRKDFEDLALLYDNVKRELKKAHDEINRLNRIIEEMTAEREGTHESDT